MQLRTVTSAPGGLGAAAATGAKGRERPGARAAASRSSPASSLVGVERRAPPPVPQQQQRQADNPPVAILSGASSGASARQGPHRPGKGGMEDAHVLAALTPCTGAASAGSTSRAAAAAAAAAAEALSFGGLADGPLSNGGGVALARLGPRAGLRVPLSPAAAAALALGGCGATSLSSADDGDTNGGGCFFGAASRTPQMPPSHLLMAGVFDGHAGHHTARQAALHLPRLVHQALVREQTALLRRGLLGGRRRRNGSPPSSPDNTPANATTTSTTDTDAEPPPQCLSGIDAAADAAEAALALAFPAFDKWWADARCDPALTRHGWDESGSTAVVALLAGDRLVVANAGDSVALLVRPSGGGGGGGAAASPFVTRLTVEHRADNEEEARRVVSAGGRILSHLGPGGSMRHSPSPSASDVDDDGGSGGGRGASPLAAAPPRPRISGMSANTRYRSAAVTRALGDFAFKLPHPLLIPEPHVCSRRLEKGDDLLLLASDGVTDALSDEAAAEVALTAARRERRRLEAAVGARTRELGAALLGGASLSSLPDAELRRALRQAVARAAADAVVREAHARGSGDDATCVAVFLDWERTAAASENARLSNEGVVLPSSSRRR